MKSTDEFHADGKRKDGFFPWCCACRSVYNKAFKSKSQDELDKRSIEYTEKSKANNTLKKKINSSFISMLHRYGITSMDLLAMLNAQENKCAICLAVFDYTHKGAFVIDHDHSNGKVRGLLCDACNMGLGSFADKESALLAAVDYLRNPPAYSYVVQYREPVLRLRNRSVRGQEDRKVRGALVEHVFAAMNTAVNEDSVLV